MIVDVVDGLTNAPVMNWAVIEMDIHMHIWRLEHFDSVLLCKNNRRNNQKHNANQKQRVYMNRGGFE